MATPAPATPSRVGRYDILERLAVGGMAEVFLACERGAHGFERLVVVKRILPHLAQHESMVRMFLQEARVVARISHPNVVQILELGEDAQGTPFIAMEYVAGSTLRELVAEAKKQRRLVPVGVAVWLVAQACAGAHAAHELKDAAGKPAGLVHRDLSPHNLMVDPQGHVKLLDFGIAKGVDDEHTTKTGVLKGKLRYLSPEQCRQDGLDRRSDLFTLGIVAWEILAGDRLFEQPTELQTLQAITNATIRDLRRLRPEVPEPVVAVIEKALAADPDARWPTADAFRRALLSAAGDCGLQPSQDVAAAFVEQVLGAKHLARQAHVESALEKTTHTANEPEDVPPPTVPTNPTGLSRPGIGAVSMVGFAVASVALLGAVVVLVGWLAWSRGTGVAAVASDPDAGYADPPGAPVDVALAPFVDPDVLEKEYEPLRRYLGRHLGRPVHWKIADSYEGAADLVEQGTVPFASLPPYQYVLAARHPGIRLLAIKQYDGSSGYDGLLYVREGFPATSAKDLKGRTICYADEHSTSGYVLPRAWFRTNGVDPDKDLSGHVSGNHFQALRDVVSGVCDVTGTYNGGIMSADKEGVPVSKLRLFASTGRTPHDAFVAGPAADVGLATQLQRALLELDPQRDVGMARIGDTERITGFVPPDDAAYDAVRAALPTEERR